MEDSKKFTAHGFIRAERCIVKLKYEKIKNSFFPLERALISQLFLLDKLVNGQGLYSKKYFLDCYSLSNIQR
jgi:hypothetical protein